MPTFFKMLDLSTAHLPQKVCENLNRYNSVTADKSECGWLLSVPEDINDVLRWNNGAVPTAVVHIWRHAQKHDCQYVLIDRDGAKYEELPIYQWE